MNSDLAALQQGDLAASAHVPSSTNFWGLALGTIGVVYGDIGTSPLYAFRESISAATGSANAAGQAVVLGALSLILWSLDFNRDD
jgi:KUP system potassium uptake protein